MIPIVLSLGALAFVISLIGTGLMRSLGHRLRAHDTAALGDQVKEAPRAIPNTGGYAIAAAIWIPVLVGLLGAQALDPERLPSSLDGLVEMWPLLTERLSLGWGLLVAILIVHTMGAIDDRRPLGPMVKVLVMLFVSALFAIVLDTRLLTMLDAIVGGTWLSVIVTIVWITLVMNAMNFIDNTDGLSAGVAAIAGGLFLIAALLSAQWFIGAMLALLVGACLGFLVFNFPPAKIFMGDSGSLVIGLVLAITTVRTTYIPDGVDVDVGALWYALLMPIAVLAVPIYDFASVTLIRLSQGKSPFVGDLQHFSHRLRARGLSVRSTILVIYALTAISGISGILLTRVGAWEAALLGVQIVATLGAIAIFEYKSSRREGLS